MRRENCQTPQTQTIVYEYDKAGRLIKEVVSTRENDGRIEYAVTRYVYDKTGNCTYIRLPEGGEILREYNAADRLIAETHIDKKGGIHNRTGFTYDKAGNLVCITDNQGNKIQIEYDLLNRETRTMERDGGVTRQFYGLNGNVIKRIHPNEYHKNQENGAGYLYIYDLQGRVSKITGPDGNILQKNIYDRVGRLLRQTVWILEWSIHTIMQEIEYISARQEVLPKSLSMMLREISLE